MKNVYSDLNAEYFYVMMFHYTDYIDMYYHANGIALTSEAPLDYFNMGLMGGEI